MAGQASSGSPYLEVSHAEKAGRGADGSHAQLTFLMQEPAEVTPSDVQDILADRFAHDRNTPSLRAGRRRGYHHKSILLRKTL